MVWKIIIIINIQYLNKLRNWYNGTMTTPRRFYVSQQNIKKKRFLIADDGTARHIGLVLRLKKGDKIILFDGEGREYNARIGYLDKVQVAGVVLDELPKGEERKPIVYLAQALPRAGKLDEIIRMNTEIGVRGFVLFESEYSVPKIASYDSGKMERLRRVTLEALRQSEGLYLPELLGPELFPELFKFKTDRKILLHSRDTAGAVDLKKMLPELTPGTSVLVIIGPEGGFSPAELKLAQRAKAEIAYLDLPVLRTETAGIVTSGLILA
jgi:16S rRNA (uracil1498-N3)-methyltransferase